MTFCDPVDCTPPGSSVHGHSPGKNTGEGCHALLQGIFPIQELHPGLPHFRQILYHLSHQGSPEGALLIQAGNRNSNHMRGNVRIWGWQSHTALTWRRGSRSRPSLQQAEPSVVSCGVGGGEGMGGRGLKTGWAKLSGNEEQPIQKETAPYSGRGG